MLQHWGRPPYPCDGGTDGREAIFGGGGWDGSGWPVGEGGGSLVTIVCYLSCFGQVGPAQVDIKLPDDSSIIATITHRHRGANEA